MEFFNGYHYDGHNHLHVEHYGQDDFLGGDFNKAPFENWPTVIKDFCVDDVASVFDMIRRSIASASASGERLEILVKYEDNSGHYWKTKFNYDPELEKLLDEEDEIAKRNTLLD
jgi:hypothetical protein